MATTVELRGISDYESEVLEGALGRLPHESRLAEALATVLELQREGRSAVVGPSDTYLTPSQVAQRLGISRTHLYKLMDGGRIASVRVGRDRRLRLADVLRYEADRDQARHATAQVQAGFHDADAELVRRLTDSLGPAPQ